MAWCFRDEFNTYAAAVQDTFQQYKAIVPAIWLFEVANVLRVGEKRNRLTENDSIEFCNLLAQLPIEIAQVPALGGVTGLVVESRISGLFAYDAAYVSLAKEKSLPLATLDSRVIAAAQALGAPIFSPELGGGLQHNSEDLDLHSGTSDVGETHHDT